MARSIWQCKAQKEPLDNSATVSLKQIKASLSQLHGTVGLLYDFDEQNNRITVAKTDLKDSDLATELAPRPRIKNELLRNGAMTMADLKARLPDIKGETVERTTRRMESDWNELIHLEDGTWAVAE